MSSIDITKTQKRLAISDLDTNYISNFPSRNLQQYCQFWRFQKLYRLEKFHAQLTTETDTDSFMFKSTFQKKIKTIIKY